ncbi:hypothetical protein LX15_005171 [Streptoalloteichus tenebrarius]|uniref:Uncharacterized protein n=1 Tax=Streptoalloteichus tenebrarius (strain ATCC 17920 / DSM 40477 / JCM 4838 / CBS 697.72 / NBRC 16177 / NCIMB 11028 / NRRL B-12390 / A12253. 1 / ISP 5477) TaxID=1933 RepID=A0ABT1I115_STRSD|nr:hypothetical protein [Streptoalloteichus tenebrarius]MCP2261445.1 hypothetical protein [Streptoalloteichus tenebrarius]BFE99681.1 hypothetical protein GCM10020241_13570 [Streptoalloteichus tenebrarius]
MQNGAPHPQPAWDRAKSRVELVLHLDDVLDQADGVPFGLADRVLATLIDRWDDPAWR